MEVGIGFESADDNILKIVNKAGKATTNMHADAVKMIQKAGMKAKIYIITGLPGETEESYYNSVKVLIDNGLRISTYTLMMLMGAELGRSQARNQFSMKSQKRIFQAAHYLSQQRL